MTLIQSRPVHLLQLGSLVLLMIGLSCCGRQSAKSDAKYDSLFLGISLGMEKKSFYDHCWELNRQKVVTHGPKNQEVEYLIKGDMKQPVYMRFYPTFYNDHILEMPVLYSYESWAPWNKQLSSDSLLIDVLAYYKNTYGDNFKSLQHKTMGTVYYKIDGRRRINLFIRDDQFVQAVFSDMRQLTAQAREREKLVEQQTQ
ncbi:hypothetical protein WBG78_26690 [Chryseolinea sp. T2]|uniref:hypothetical protein n=1 Tax=Chryseolinea sp. T2 TaxID=3129255 RepID=UPI003078175D